MKIHAIRTGSVRVRTAQMRAPHPGPLGIVGIFMDPNWSDWLPTYAWAIEHKDGVIVVDTGQTTSLLREATESLHPYVRWEARFQIEPEQEIGPQLLELGIGPKDVRKVILTHLHMDHDSGLAHFPNSEVIVARGEIGRANGLIGALRGYLPHRWPSWFDPKPLDLTDGPIRSFAASKRLTVSGDIVAVATPGHTPDHISVLVEDENVSLLFAGDSSYNQDLMVAGRVDGVSSNAALSKSTLQAIKQSAVERPMIYLPTHDPDSGRRLAEREIVVPRLGATNE
jgi:N-acyl homoserine lactone hydrolase